MVLWSLSEFWVLRVMYFKGWCCCTAASLTFAVWGPGHQDLPLTQHTYTHHVRSQQKQGHNTHTHAAQESKEIVCTCSLSFSLSLLLFLLLNFNGIFSSNTPVSLTFLLSSDLMLYAVSSAVYQVLHIVFLSMCSSESPFLFFSFIWSSLLYPSLSLSCALPSVCEAPLAQIPR